MSMVSLRTESRFILAKAKSSYFQKLLDPRWQKKRLEIFQRDEFTCRECYLADKTLHVHHGFYRSNTDPWDYPSESLHTLCEDCHQGIQRNLQECHEIIGSFSMEQFYGILELLRAIGNAPYGDSLMALLACEKSLSEMSDKGACV